jgi:hypothetical protein
MSSNFIFTAASSQIANNTLDLSTGTYYAHIVTASPPLTALTVADLTIPTAIGYQGVLLTNASYNPSRWTFDPCDFPTYSYPTAPIGLVVCKRLGSSFAATDPVIVYSDFANSTSQVVSTGVGSYAIENVFSSLGAIEFQNRYKYVSGAFLNIEPVPKGSIFQMGSNNNTATFANPTPSKFQTIITDANSNKNPSPVLSDRNTGTQFSVIGTMSIAYDFGTIKINPGVVGIYNYYASSGTDTVVIWGSNNLGGNFTANCNNTALYQQIGAGTISNWNFSWGLFNCNPIDYWQYILINISSNTHSLAEIEFYGSSVLSATANFV